MAASIKQHEEYLDNDSDLEEGLLDSLEEEDVKSEFFLEVPVTLHSSEAKRLYRRVLNHIQTHITAATVMLRKYRENNLADKNAAAIDAALDKLQEDLQKDMAYADAVLDDVGITELVTTTGKRDVIAKISCPQGSVVLNLIRQVDLFAIKQKTLWMKGEVSTAETERAVHGWQSRIFKATNAIRNLGREAYIAVEKRKQADAEKLAKDRERRRLKRQKKREESNQEEADSPVETA